MTIQTETVQPTQIVQAVEKITSFENYGLSWLVYILLTFVMIGIIWWILRKLHFIVNWFFASVILAGALTPTHPVENATTFSPLILSAIVELFDDNKAAFMDGIKTIIIVWSIVFVVGLAMWFGVTYWLKTKPTNDKASENKHSEKSMATPIEPTIDTDSE